MQVICYLIVSIFTIQLFCFYCDLYVLKSVFKPKTSKGVLNMILSDVDIKHSMNNGYISIEPFFSKKQNAFGLSYGLSCAGYDIRLSLAGIVKEVTEDSVIIVKAKEFLLASAIERVRVPRNMISTLKDKSTNARLGLSVFNTVFEAGWEGYPTIEIVNNSNHNICLEHGRPIGQMLFHKLSCEVENPYSGKYQFQEAKPVNAILE